MDVNQDKMQILENLLYRIGNDFQNAGVLKVF